MKFYLTNILVIIKAIEIVKNTHHFSGFARNCFDKMIPDIKVVALSLAITNLFYFFEFLNGWRNL